MVHWHIGSSLFALFVLCTTLLDSVQSDCGGNRDQLCHLDRRFDVREDRLARFERDSKQSIWTSDSKREDNSFDRAKRVKAIHARESVERLGERENRANLNRRELDRTRDNREVRGEGERAQRVRLDTTRSRRDSRAREADLNAGNRVRDTGENSLRCYLIFLKFCTMHLNAEAILYKPS